MEFKNKTIIIISQQGWSDGIVISKHHYAIELAKRGNKVYFMGGPSDENFFKTGKININKTQFENLYVIEHELFYPLLIKFKLPWLHHILVTKHINKILKKAGVKPDIIWSFDLSNTIPLTAFPVNSFKLFMPVDEPSDPVAFKAAKSAQIIISVTDEIINKYKNFQIPRFCINHGVADFFINDFPKETIHNPPVVALSGNFLRPDLDRPVLLDILMTNPGIHFNFFGKIDDNRNQDEEVNSFIQKIRQLPNVTLKGSLSPLDLAKMLKRADAFLICYDIKKDQSRGTNYHKLLEYLAAGKVIITNNVTTYKDHPELVVMNTSRENNDSLPALFEKVMKDLPHYNSLELQQKRIRFAEKFRYSTQLTKIEKLLS